MKRSPGVVGFTIPCTKTFATGFNLVSVDYFLIYWSQPNFLGINQPPTTGWFIFVQAMMTLSMLFAIFALMAIAVPIMHFALKYNVIMIGLAFVLESLAGKSSVEHHMIIGNCSNNHFLN